MTTNRIRHLRRGQGVRGHGRYPPSDWRSAFSGGIGAMLTAFAAGMVLLACVLVWVVGRRGRVQART